MWKRRPKKKARKPLFKIYFLISLLVLSAFVFTFLKSGLFNIKKIDIEGQPCAGYEEIKNASALMGQNFFLVNKTKAEDSVKKKFICIKKAEVKRTLPDKVKLNIINRQALAILADLKQEASLSATPSAEEVNDYYMVDDEGVVFGKAGGEGGALIYALGLELSVGGSLGKKAQDLVKVMEKIKNSGLESRQSIVNGEIFTVDLNPPVSRIILKLSEDLDVQLASLQLIVDKAKIDSEQLEFIDLRFDKPVVKIAPKK